MFKKILIALAFIVMPVTAATIEEQLIVDDSFLGNSDFHPEDGSFLILGTEPLRILVAPRVFPGEPADILTYQTYRAALYGIYRTFMQTDIDQVEVTSLPLNMKELVDNGNFSYWPEYRITITKTRAEALADLKKHTRAVSIESLQGKGYEAWSPAWKEIYYNDKKLVEFVDKIK